MWWVLKTPFAWALIAYFAVNIGLGIALGPATCRDGWASPSIGHGGACSWHGGVDKSKGAIAFLGGLLAGFGAFAVADCLRRKDDPIPDAQSNHLSDPQPTPPAGPRYPPEPGGITCPKCGGATRRRTARRGKFAGREFWGCANYPSCDGAQSIKRGKVRDGIAITTNGQ